MKSFAVALMGVVFCAASVLTGCANEGDDVAGGGAGKNEEGLTVAICGTIRGFAAPDETSEGALWMDERIWPIAKDAQISSPELLVRGDRVCIDATFDEKNRIDTCVAMESFPDE